MKECNTVSLCGTIWQMLECLPDLRDVPSQITYAMAVAAVDKLQSIKEAQP